LIKREENQEDLMFATEIYYENVIMDSDED